MPTTKNSPITIGDILKSEADRNSRVAITAPEGTKIGQPVLYEPRGEYLIALSDEENGKVLVQPWNCVIYLEPIAQASLEAISIDGEEEEDATPLSKELLIKQGDKYGIKYIGMPKTT